MYLATHVNWLTSIDSRQLDLFFFSMDNNGDYEGTTIIHNLKGTSQLLLAFFKQYWLKFFNLQYKYFGYRLTGKLHAIYILNLNSIFRIRSSYICRYFMGLKCDCFHAFQRTTSNFIHFFSMHDYFIWAKNTKPLLVTTIISVGVQKLTTICYSPYILNSACYVYCKV